MKRGQYLKLAIALSFLALISISLSLFNANIDKIYPNLAIQPDFLLDHTPYVNILWLADFISTLAAVSFWIYIFVKKKIKYVPFYAVILGIFDLIRGLLIYITPLGNPYPGNAVGCTALMKFYSSNCSWGGMFPSGHVGTIFLFFLFTLKNKTKYWSIYFISLVIIEIIAMILCKGHYTIDIVGAVFITYGIWKIFDEHFKEKLILK